MEEETKKQEEAQQQEEQKQEREKFIFRAVTQLEANKIGLMCCVMKPNQRQCERKISKKMGEKYLCEGHFMELLQTARLNPKYVEIINLDEPPAPTSEPAA